VARRRATPTATVFPQSADYLLGGRNVIDRKIYQQEGTLDDGQWLRPLIAGTAEKTRSQPDAGAVARIREVVLYRIERESVSLVA
jgi:hypothetical protein